MHGKTPNFFRTFQFPKITSFATLFVASVGSTPLLAWGGWEKPQLFPQITKSKQTVTKNRRYDQICITK